MRTPGPVLALEQFGEVQQELLSLLKSLTPEEWTRPTVNPKWYVKDIAAHLLWGDLGRLSRERDGWLGSLIQAKNRPEFVSLLNQQNDAWVNTACKFRTRVLCDLLALLAPQVYSHFKTLDPFAIGDSVSWVGPEPAPVWLDIAREYTEKWHHQQQIREAVGKPGLTEPRYLSPVLQTFIRALPKTFSNVQALQGTHVKLFISGESGGVWSVIKEQNTWGLYLNINTPTTAEIVIPEDSAWKLFTKTITKDEALPECEIRGERSLCLKLLDTVSVIA